MGERGKNIQKYRCHKQEGKKIFEKVMDENEIYVCVDGIEEHLEGNIENVRWNLDGEVEYASSPIQNKKLKLYIIDPGIPKPFATK